MMFYNKLRHLTKNNKTPLALLYYTQDRKFMGDQRLTLQISDDDGPDECVYYYPYPNNRLVIEDENGRERNVDPKEYSLI